MQALVFGLLGFVIVYETRRGAEKTRRTEQRKMQEFNDLETEKNRLMRRMEDQVILTKRLKEVVAEYSRQVGCTLPRDPEKADGENEE